MRPSTRVLTVLIASLSLMGLQVQLAQAALDRTPPVLTVPDKAAFVVGSILAEPYPDPDLAKMTYGIQQLLTWSATDNTGVFSYSLWNFPCCAEPGPILDPTNETQYVAVVTDYDDEFGGGSERNDGWTVTARDSFGNATTKRIFGGSGNAMGVTQENNVSKFGPSGYGQITYTGSWSTANCLCFLQGHTARTSSVNARATFTRTYEQGDHVALVMAKGPGRGRATIRVDGVVVATIDTFASVNTNRVVVFERMMSAGTHTVSITNLATAGRARIDLDAVMTN